MKRYVLMDGLFYCHKIFVPVGLRFMLLTCGFVQTCGCEGIIHRTCNTVSWCLVSYSQTCSNEGRSPMSVKSCLNTRLYWKKTNKADEVKFLWKFTLSLCKLVNLCSRVCVKVHVSGKGKRNQYFSERKNNRDENQRMF